MTLRITAYSGLNAVRRLAAVESKTASHSWCIPRSRANAGAIDAQLVYTAQQTFRFDVGSYSRYVRWLEQLARLVGIPSIDLFWCSPKPTPFAELLDFADCNATMGTAACAKLAHDFGDWALKAARHGEPYFRDQYVLWHRACDIAAQQGCISLHSDPLVSQCMRA